MSDVPQNSQNQIDTSIAEIWLMVKSAISFVWRKKGWIILVSLLFGLGGYLKVHRAAPTFSASLTFTLEQGGTGGSLSGLASQFGFSIGSGGDALGGENLLSLMKSRRIIEDVLFSKIASGADSIFLIDQYLSTLPEVQSQWYRIGVLPFKRLNQMDRSQDSAVGLIVKQLAEQSLAVSKVDKQLSLVTVSYSGHDPVFTKHFVELLSEKASDFYVETKMSNSRANIKKLERRVDSISDELNLAMVGYSLSQDQNQFTVQSVAKVPAMQKQIKVTMLTALYGELVKNLELSKTMAAHEEPLITIIDTPHFPLRVPDSKRKSALIASSLGGFLCIAFFGARALLQNLNQQAKQFEKK